MRQYNLLSSFSSLETLELKLSPTSLTVGLAAHAVVSAPTPQAQTDDDDDGDDDGGNGNGDGDNDPLPDPEPEPGPDPGDNPPINYPFLPPSGPSGPGA
jgi:hypothetical protein